VQEDQIHVGLAKGVAGGLGLPGIVNQTEIHDLDPGSGEMGGDEIDIAAQTASRPAN
jgi:hypothetical protein